MDGIYLLLGSNQGDRKAYLQTAIDELEHAGCRVTCKSQIYETAPWGNEDQPAFLNQIIKIETGCKVMALLKTCQHIEKKLDRTREKHWGPRTIDIDILYFHNLVVQTRELALPHPRICERRFTLAPLMELAPEQIDPFWKMPVKDLMEKCTDCLQVSPLEDEKL